MSDDVGKIGSTVSSAPSSDAPTSPADAPGVRAVVLVAPGSSNAPVGALATTDPYSDGVRAIELYVGGQLSTRSRQNALDALRRLARMILRSEDAVPADVPWPVLDYEQATIIRTGLYEMTRAGAITPGTANLTLSHLRGLLRTMYGMRLIDSDQEKRVRGALKNVRGSRQARGRALSVVEEKALRAAAIGLGGYQGVMLDTAIVLAIGGGLRREEIAQLAVEGLSPGFLQVVGKGNKEKRVSIDAQMQAAVDAWLKERLQLAPGHGGLFCSPQRPEWTLSSWSFWSLVRMASHKAFGDVDPCAKRCRCLKIVTGPHDFRRTFATRLLDQGVDISQTQQLMGHESIETTARYDKRDIEALFEKRRNMRIIA